TPDKRGWFRYGSPHVTMVADNTEPQTLAATGYDDDGVACQRWDIVREGIFVDYCTSREVAPKIGEPRSHGSNRADGWGRIPTVRFSYLRQGTTGTIGVDDSSRVPCAVPQYQRHPGLNTGKRACLSSARGKGSVLADPGWAGEKARGVLIVGFIPLRKSRALRV